MLSPTLEAKLLRQMATLPEPQQQRVLEYARSLAPSRPRGVPGRSLERFVGTIPAADLAEMQAAIEADCERVDSDGW